MTSEQLDDFRTDIDQLIKANKREQGEIRAYLGIDEAKLILAHIDEQQSEIDMLRGSLEECRLDFAGLKKDNARLRESIKKHKSEVWGKVEVSHPDDADLYAALYEVSDD